MMVRQPILLHMHLFKNAGSTFDWALHRTFGEAFVDHRDDQEMRGNPSYLHTYLKERPQVTALSSHWLPMPLSPPLLEHCALIAFLRDPMERALSVYRFERHQTVSHPGTEQAKRTTFAEYVAWRLQPSTGPVLRNYQVRMLSGVYPGAGDDEQLSLAEAHLGQFALLGLVDRFDESMVLLEELLRESIPNIDLAYRRQNVSDPSDRRDFHERRVSIESQLGSAYDQLEAENRLDSQLYQRAAKAFDERWKALADNTEKLSQFRQRCGELVSE